MHRSLLLCLLAAASSLHGQGPLSPPAAPAPTMKRLDQIEPRTPIPGGTAPFTISASGSYYLTGNLTVAGADAITVNASNVTVDLNGFTIASTASPAAGTAVLISSGTVNVTVRNGHISGPGTVSATGSFTGGGFANGVLYASSSATDTADGMRAYDLTITGCSGDGINLFAFINAYSSSVAERCVVRHVGRYGVFATTQRACSVYNCGGTGILAFVASDCLSFVNGGTGSGIQANSASNCLGSTTGTGDAVGGTQATNCYAYSKGGNGINVSTAINCRAQTDNGPAGLSSLTATNCYAVNNTGNGSASTGLTAGAATGCQAYYYGPDGGVGLRTNTSAQCSAYSTSGRGLDASTAENCTGGSGSSIGLYASETATNCTASTNSGQPALLARVAVGCTGTNTGNGSGVETTFSVANCYGSSNTGRGISTGTALNSKGVSAATYGLFASDTATNCTGETTGGTVPALLTGTATGCIGRHTGGGNGLEVTVSALNCYGKSANAYGARGPTLTSCYGETSNSAIPALFAVVAHTCRGVQTTGSGFAIKAEIGTSCTAGTGTYAPSVMQITYRYNMPAN